MKGKQRSVDYDGLDGILQLPETAREAPKWYQASWLYALIVAGLAGALLVYNQNHPASPRSLSVQTDSAGMSQASNHDLGQESSDLVSKNPERDNDNPQTDSLHDRQTPAISTEATAENHAVNLEQSTASSQTEAPAATSSGILFTVHFKFNSSKLNLLSKSERDDLIHAAENCSNLVKLTGHTCNMGPAEVNKRIGLARANSVKKLLSANGIPAQDIAIASEGMDSPAVPNDSPSQAAKNRRVELTCRDR